MKIYDVAIIGAGPAGIMAAITAAKRGNEVLLIEKNEVLGRKILATGNGRCNLTNKNITTDRYHGSNELFIQTILEKYDQFQTISFFENLGVALKEEAKGRIFPRSNQASTIVEALKHALLDSGVIIKTGTTVKNITNDDEFLIALEDGETISTKKLILATGGKAAFQFGSSGDGIFWAKNLGHKIVPIYAALVPLETEESWVKDVQGIKLEAKLTSKINDEKIKETWGDLIFTHFGISGPAAMSQGGAISPLVADKKVKIEIDLYPELSDKDLDAKVENLLNLNSKKTIKNSLTGLFPASIVPIILNESGINQEKKSSEVSKIQRKEIVKTIKHLTLNIKKVRPLKEAQVSRGGIDTTEINPENLESKLVKNLYFAGEILDVDADSGGFNLQWAWSSGHIAGSN